MASHTFCSHCENRSRNCDVSQCRCQALSHQAHVARLLPPSPAVSVYLAVNISSRTTGSTSTSTSTSTGTATCKYFMKFTVSANIDARATSHDSTIVGAIQLSCPGGGWKDSGTKLSLSFVFEPQTQRIDSTYVVTVVTKSTSTQTRTHPHTHTCAACSKVLR